MSRREPPRSVRLPEALNAQVAAYLAITGRSFGSLVTDALTAYFATNLPEDRDVLGIGLLKLREAEHCIVRARKRGA